MGIEDCRTLTLPEKKVSFDSTIFDEASIEIDSGCS